MANGNFGGGNGSTTAPYLVEDAADFKAVRNRLNAHYRQTQDIDFEGISYSIFYNFTGSYEGNGFKIKNITLNSVGSTTDSHLYGVALFGSIQNPGVVQNVHIENGQFSFTNPGKMNHTVYMGGIVGQIMPGYTTNSTPVTNCSFQGTMTCSSTTTSGTRLLSGIVGYYYSANAPLSIKNCSANATMSLVSVTGSLSGISFGMNSYNCHFTGSMEGEANEIVGIGNRDSYDCSVSNATLVSTRSSGRVCGINGHNADFTQRCTVTNSILTAVSTSVGIGGSDPSNCSVVNTTITATGTSSSDCAFGITNSLNTKVSRCLVKDCTITGSYAAGIAGSPSSSNSVNITDCAVVGGTIESKHTSGSAAGMAINPTTSGTPIVLRSYCSANVIGRGSGLAGILVTSAKNSYVRNSFYLGEYLKGLGAETSSVGFISNIPLTGNQNNYSLDTAQIILE